MGYAEADPTLDIGGCDAAHKLALLRSLAFGASVEPEQVMWTASSRSRQADIEAARQFRLPHHAAGVALSAPSVGIEKRG